MSHFRKYRDGAWLYIMTNRRNGTLYLGVTSNLPQRVWQHREGVVEGFTKQHGLKMLVWYERFDRIKRCNPTREDDEALAACLEGAAHPRDESGVE